MIQTGFHRQFLICGLILGLSLSQSTINAQNINKPLIDASTGDWSSYNHNSAGWRFNAAEKMLSPDNVNKLVEKWRFPAEGSAETIGVVHATPAVVDGEVYFGTANFPAFYKLDRVGKKVWEFRSPARKAVLPPTGGSALTNKLRDAAAEGGIFSSALVFDGSVFFC